MNHAYIDGQKRLKNAYLADRLSHATVITGDDVLCSDLADFAASLIFEKQGEELFACVDYLRLDGASMKVLDVDELLETVAVAPSSKKRVIAIKNAGNMSVTIQNMLLKTVEEPPKDNHFIFFGNESGILPTIRSRCAYLTLGEISYEDIAEYLILEGAEKSYAEYLAYLSGGSVSIAKKLYSDENFLKFTYAAAEYFLRLKKHSLFTESLRDFATENPEYAVYVFELCLSDLRRIKLGMDVMHFSRQPIFDLVSDCAKRVSEKEISDISEVCKAAKKAIGLKVPPRQVFDNLAAKIEEKIS